jgi:hypothetical protein
MTDFDLRRSIRAIVEETDLASPEEITEKLAGQIPARDLRAVVTVLLRDYVRVELSRLRMGAHGGDNPDATTNRSAKVAAIRAAAPRWLRDRVFVGGSEWKLLGDCTADNLSYLQQERRDNAARSLAAAEFFASLEKLVRRHKVARVSDLPPRALGTVGELAA